MHSRLAVVAALVGLLTAGSSYLSGQIELYRPDPCPRAQEEKFWLHVTVLRGESRAGTSPQGALLATLDNLAVPNEMALRLLPPPLRQRVRLGPVPFAEDSEFLGTYFHGLNCDDKLPEGVKIVNPFHKLQYRLSVREWSAKSLVVEIRGRLRGRSFGPWSMHGDPARASLAAARVGDSELLFVITPMPKGIAGRDPWVYFCDPDGEYAKAAANPQTYAPRLRHRVLPKLAESVQAEVDRHGPQCVALGIWINKEGAVDIQRVELLSAPHAALATAALQGVAGWRFDPAHSKDGTPREAWAHVQFSFYRSPERILRPLTKRGF